MTIELYISPRCSISRRYNPLKCSRNSSPSQSPLYFCPLIKKDGVPFTPLRIPLSKSDSTLAEVSGQNFSMFCTPEDIARDEPSRLLAEARDNGRCIAEGWRV